MRQYVLADLDGKTFSSETSTGRSIYHESALLSGLSALYINPNSWQRVNEAEIAWHVLDMWRRHPPPLVLSYSLSLSLSRPLQFLITWYYLQINTFGL